MTAVELAQGEHVDCPDCAGVGEVGTGIREYETGFEITRNCGPCDASGQVDVERARLCEGCKQTFWIDEDGCCLHHGDHCTVCKPLRCEGCEVALREAQRLEDAADYLTHLRSLTDPMSGRIDNWSSR